MCAAIWRALSRAMQNGVDVRGLLRLVAARQLRVGLGYERRFGLVHVDFETQRRTPKLSALAYANTLRQR